MGLKSYFIHCHLSREKFKNFSYFIMMINLLILCGEFKWHWKACVLFLASSLSFFVCSFVCGDVRNGDVEWCGGCVLFEF